MVEGRSEKTGSKFGMPVPVNHGIWDASDEEAPPSNPTRKDLTRNMWLEAISMLVAMRMEDGLRQGALMATAKRFGMAHSTSY